MRSDLERFENRSDDWLAKQRKYEEKVSAWDFDEGKRIKEEHHIKHLAYDSRQEIRKNIRTDSLTKSQAQKASLLMFIFSFIVMFLLFIFSMFF